MGYYAEVVVYCLSVAWDCSGGLWLIWGLFVMLYYRWFGLVLSGDWWRWWFMADLGLAAICVGFVLELGGWWSYGLCFALFWLNLCLFCLFCAGFAWCITDMV